MKKKDIEKAYNKLVSEIESIDMYDGRNTVDRYTCDCCGYMVYTTYKDKGVTPFMIRCTRCGGTMFHDKTYNKEIVPKHIIVLDWYRPSLKQTLKLSEGEIDHVLNGGLLLKKNQK